MDENRNNEQRGMGVGYVTLIMLFAVICLTVLAALSYQAARANDKLNEKSVSFTDSFYAADYRAKEQLSQLDSAALAAHNSGFFEDSFSMYCSERDKFITRNTSEGFEVSFSESINNTLALSVKIVFFNTPENGVRYRIQEWKTTVVSDDTEDETLGVWNGGNLT